MGTVRIEPPPPMAPSDSPITVPSTIARIACTGLSPDGEALARPGDHAAGKVAHLGEARCRKHSCRHHAPIAAAADRDHLFGGVELAQTSPERVQGDMQRARNVAFAPFVELAHVHYDRALRVLLLRL